MPQKKDMKPDIIGVCFNVYGTGLTRVMHEVLRPLVDTYDIHFLGIGYSGPRVDDGGLHIYPTNPNGGDVFAAFQALDLVQERDAPVVFVLHDLWHFRNYTKVFESIRDRAKFVAYIPLDGNLVDDEMARPLHGLDRVVVYNEWARRELAQAFDRLRASGETRQLPPIDVVFHGVDTNAFRPTHDLIAADFRCSGRITAKRAVFRDMPSLDDSFIVLNAARPAIRKRVDLTIDGFAIFARDKPANVRLCLHHAIADEGAQDLLKLLKERGIEDRLLYNPLSPDGGAISEANLNLLYSACDVGINTSMGEGWGLLSFEHAAAGGAQIVPRHSACGDLWDENTAEMMETEGGGVPWFSPLRMEHVSVEAVAAALERLYQDRDHLARLARAGHEYTCLRQFDWSVIASDWRRIFRDVLEMPNSATVPVRG